MGGVSSVGGEREERREGEMEGGMKGTEIIGRFR